MRSIVYGPKWLFYSYCEYIGLFGTGICRYCIWVELPVQRRLCPIFVKKCRVTRHSRVFRGFTGSQRTPGFWGVTGTPCIKSGSGQSVPVHPKCVLVHMCRKLTVVKVYRYTTNVYRYTCMRIARLGQKFDQYTRALLSTDQNGKITLEGSIKARGHKEKAAFDF